MPVSLPPAFGAVSLTPGSAARNTITPQADDAYGLFITTHSPTATAPMLRCLANGALSSALSVRPPATGTGLSVFCSAGDPGDVALTVQGAVNTQERTLHLLSLDASGNAQSELNVAAGDSQVQWMAQFSDDPTSAGQAFSIVPSLTATLAASYKARVDLNVGDAGGIRRAIRMEADGANPRIGFLGAAAVVRQTGASAAGIASVADAATKAALTALQNVVAQMGLATSPA